MEIDAGLRALQLESTVQIVQNVRRSLGYISEITDYHPA